MRRHLSFLLFGDGATAALVTRRADGVGAGGLSRRDHPGQRRPHHLAHRRPGFRHASVRQGARPHRRRAASSPGPQHGDDLLRGAGGRRRSICGRCMPAAARCWTRSRSGLRCRGRRLPRRARVLREFGNMSSATIMFVLAARCCEDGAAGDGMAMAFGPGMVAETFRFQLKR